jgi:hypothetical protein
MQLDAHLSRHPAMLTNNITLSFAPCKVDINNAIYSKEPSTNITVHLH